MNARDKIKRKARKSKNEYDWTLYKRLKNSSNNKIKKAKQEYQIDLLTENSHNPAKFWKCMKDIFSDKRTSTCICNHQ